MQQTLGTSNALVETVRRFREDLLAYAQLCLYIRDKQSKIHPLTLNRPQEIVHQRIEAQLAATGRIRAIVLKARQEGISTYVAARFFRAVHLWSGISAMVVADAEKRASSIFDIYSRYYERLPGEIRPRVRSSQRRSYLSFTHDSDLSVRPASDTESGRAMTIHRLHASELAYWGNAARDTWTSLMEAVPVAGSEVIIESTAKGAGGLFHEIWEAAERAREANDQGGWLSIFLPWWILDDYSVSPVPPDIEAKIRETPDEFERQAMEDGIPYEGENHVLPIEKLAWRRMVLVEKYGSSPEHPSKDAVRKFQQENPATAEEAFLMAGNCFFDEDALRTYTREQSEPIIRGRLSLKEENGHRYVEVAKARNGACRIWEEPNELDHYVIGVDTAEHKLLKQTSVMETEDQSARDFSAAVVLRLPRGDRAAGVVAELHGPLAPEMFTEQLRLLGDLYSCGGPKDGTYRAKALLGVERNHSSGQTILRLLREHYRYSPLFWAREINRRTRKIGRTLGWVTTGESRPLMLDRLGELVRNRNIEIPGRDLLREMVTFEVWPDGKPAAAEGCHDDRVMAFAIACQMWREHRHTVDSPLPEYEPRFEDGE